MWWIADLVRSRSWLSKELVLRFQGIPGPGACKEDQEQAKKGHDD